MLESLERLRECALALESKQALLRVDLLTIADDIEGEISERYVELPLDVDGVPIRLGDTMQGKRCGGGWGEPFKVTSMFLKADGWSVYGPCSYGRIANMCRHQPDSWERIESDAREWMQRNGTTNGVMHFIERCRALAGDAE